MYFAAVKCGHSGCNQLHKHEGFFCDIHSMHEKSFGLLPEGAEVTAIITGYGLAKDPSNKPYVSNCATPLTTPRNPLLPFFMSFYVTNQSVSGSCFTPLTTPRNPFLPFFFVGVLCGGGETHRQGYWVEGLQALPGVQGAGGLSGQVRPENGGRFDAGC